MFSFEDVVEVRLLAITGFSSEDFGTDSIQFNDKRQGSVGHISFVNGCGRSQLKFRYVLFFVCQQYSKEHAIDLFLKREHVPIDNRGWFLENILEYHSEFRIS